MERRDAHESPMKILLHKMFNKTFQGFQVYLLCSCISSSLHTRNRRILLKSLKYYCDIFSGVSFD